MMVLSKAIVISLAATLTAASDSELLSLPCNGALVEYPSGRQAAVAAGVCSAASATKSVQLVCESTMGNATLQFYSNGECIGTPYESEDFCEYQVQQGSFYVDACVSECAIQGCPYIRQRTFDMVTECDDDGTPTRYRSYADSVDIRDFCVALNADESGMMVVEEDGDNGAFVTVKKSYASPDCSGNSTQEKETAFPYECDAANGVASYVEISTAYSNSSAPITTRTAMDSGLPCNGALVTEFGGGPQTAFVAGVCIGSSYNSSYRVECQDGEAVMQNFSNNDCAGTPANQMQVCRFFVDDMWDCSTECAKQGCDYVLQREFSDVTHCAGTNVSTQTASYIDSVFIRDFCFLEYDGGDGVPETHMVAVDDRGMVLEEYWSLNCSDGVQGEEIFTVPYDCNVTQGTAYFIEVGTLDDTTSTATDSSTHREMTPLVIGVVCVVACVLISIGVLYWMRHKMTSEVTDDQYSGLPDDNAL